MQRPNEWLISCKRLGENLWSISSLSVGSGRRLASPAFVGCISGLGTDGLERALSRLDVPIDLARTLNHLETGRELFARAWPR
jgi:hypothetical protein